MSKKFDVIQVGLGPMGRICAKLIIERQNLNLQAVVDIDPKLTGKPINEILNIKGGPNIQIEADLDSVLTKEKADIVFIATSSSLKKVALLIKKVIVSGSHVISICEELSFPFQSYPKLSKELDTLAKANELIIVGTGINPGYLMDLLPIVMTAPCQEVHSLKITRVMNSGKRREPFQRKIGTGLTPEVFHKKISDKEITGHVGLIESIQHISSALGFEYDEAEEFSPEEIITEKEFVTSYGETVSKGIVRGLRSKAVAKLEDKELILLDFIAYAGDHEEYDEIIIEGKPSIHQKIIGGVHGDLGTSAMVVNLIPLIVNTSPSLSGLLTMKDLPIPRNTERIWKL